MLTWTAFRANVVQASRAVQAPPAPPPPQPAVPGEVPREVRPGIEVVVSRIIHVQRAALYRARDRYAREVGSPVDFRESRRSSADSRVDVAKMPGTARMMAVRSLFPLMQVRLARFQRVAMKAMLESTVQHQYGSDYDLHGAAIREFWGIEDEYAAMAFITSRQMGKSMIMSMLIAGILLTAPGITQLICSTNQRASDLLRNGILLQLGLIQARTRSNFTFHTRGEEIIVTHTDDTGVTYTNTIRCLPDNARTMRGLRAHIVWLEEAYFISDDTMNLFVLPLFRVNRCSIVAISTPGSRHAVLGEMLKVRVDGRPMMKLVQVASMCDNCVRDRKTKCPHKLDETPPWHQVSAGQSFLTALLGNGMNGVFGAEMVGSMVSGTSSYCFESELLDLLVARKRYTFPYNTLPDYIFIGLDPASSRSNSALAAVAFMPDRDGYTLVVRAPLR